MPRKDVLIRLSIFVHKLTLADFKLPRTFYVTGDKPLGFNGEKLSSSTRTLIGITRALLSSVDLLLLANTLDSLTNKDRKRILNILKEMVLKRGMEYNLGETSLATR